MEIFLGFFVVVFVFFVMFYVFKLNNVVSNKDCYIVSAQFNSVSGVNPGSSVIISGVDVGKVRSVSLDQRDDYRVTVVMAINNGINIPRSSVAIISSNSILSDNKYIRIEPVNYGENDFLKDGDVITNTQSSINIIDIIVHKFL